MINQWKIRAKLLVMRHEVAIIPSYRIERNKWDDCIRASTNGLIYSTTLYLDHLADNWSGVVIDDYNALMAVAWRKKFGIKYCYQVPFVQQLGIISNGETPDTNIFTDALSELCSYGTYPFNYENNLANGSSHTNLILPLDTSYGIMSQRFSRDALQIIRGCETMELDYGEGKTDEAILCFRELYGKKSAVSEAQIMAFSKLCKALDRNGRLVVRRVTKDERTLAIILLATDTKRMYNLINCTLPEGKATKANYYLLSRLWMEFEASKLVFDFEGSDLPGVREFYKKFGPLAQPYFKVHFNHLPWPLKILKK